MQFILYINLKKIIIKKMSTLNYSELIKNNKYNPTFKVKIISYIIPLLIQLSKPNTPTITKMIGRKRKFDDNNRNILPLHKEINNNGYSSSQIIPSNNQNFEEIKKEISYIYNAKRSLCLSCVHTKHEKYSNNKYIPCLPFASSNH